jgi:hypothetical protein
LSSILTLNGLDRQVQDAVRAHAFAGIEGAGAIRAETVAYGPFPGFFNDWETLEIERHGRALPVGQLPVVFRRIGAKSCRSTAKKGNPGD